MPLAMAVSPGGDRIVVLLNGWREQGFQVIDRTTTDGIHDVACHAAAGKQKIADYTHGSCDQRSTVRDIGMRARVGCRNRGTGDCTADCARYAAAHSHRSAKGERRCRSTGDHADQCAQRARGNCADRAERQRPFFDEGGRGQAVLLVPVTGECSAVTVLHVPGYCVAGRIFLPSELRAVRIAVVTIC